MEKTTKVIIDLIEKSKSKDEIKDAVLREHNRIKSYLIKKGVKFYEDESQFSQDLVGGQLFHGIEDVEMARTYEELNYIRCLINGRIYQMSDEQERFNPIMKSVLSVFKTSETL